jgi:hypothetical protein
MILFTVMVHNEKAHDSFPSCHDQDMNSKECNMNCYVRQSSCMFLIEHPQPGFSDICIKMMPLETKSNSCSHNVPQSVITAGARSCDVEEAPAPT